MVRFSSLCTCSAAVVVFADFLILGSSNHCQGRHLFGGGDQGDPTERQQQRPGLPPWVWDVRHLLLCPARRGEHHGWWGDKAFLSRGAGVLEFINPQQQQLPLHQPEVDCPVGAGCGHPLWLPAASQVSSALWTQTLLTLWDGNEAGDVDEEALIFAVMQSRQERLDAVGAG